MIERSPRRHSYTVIDNRPLTDTRLDWDAKGLLAYLLSKPDHWRVDRSQLASVVPSGASKVQRLLKLLEQAGYLTRERERDEAGRLAWKHVVHEVAVPPERRTTDGFTSDGPTTDGKTTDGKSITGADQQKETVSAGGTTDGFSIDGKTTDGEQAHIVSTEGATTEVANPEQERLSGAGAPDGSDDPSLFEAQGLPNGSPGSHGSPSPHGAAPPPPGASQNGQASSKPETAKIVRTVFEAWQEATGSPRAKLTDARRKKVTARLREGFTPEQLVTVVTDGWKRDPWSGRVDNNDLVILLRDGPQVEKFLKLAAKANGNGRPALDPEQAERAERQARDFNARAAQRRAAATTTERGRQLAAQLAAAEAARKGAHQ
jgi:hypothetical protein